MNRTLIYLGLVGLAGAAWALLAAELGWVGTDLGDTIFTNTLIGGAVCLGLGLIGAVLGSLSRKMRGGRCARCSAPVEEGQTYCLDHLRETVHECQDRMRRNAG